MAFSQDSQMLQLNEGNKLRIDHPTQAKEDFSGIFPSDKSTQSDGLL